MQYLIARLYVFFENHSNSSALNCSRLGLLGLRRDTFACIEAACNQLYPKVFHNARTCFERSTQLFEDVLIEGPILDQFRYEKSYGHTV